MPSDDQVSISIVREIHLVKLFSWEKKLNSKKNSTSPSCSLDRIFMRRGGGGRICLNEKTTRFFNSLINVN